DGGREDGPKVHAVCSDLDRGNLVNLVADGGVVGEDALGAPGTEPNLTSPGADVLVDRQVAGIRLDDESAAGRGDAARAGCRADGQTIGSREAEGAGAGDTGGQHTGGDVVGLAHQHSLDGADGQVGGGDGPRVRREGFRDAAAGLEGESGHRGT